LAKTVSYGGPEGSNTNKHKTANKKRKTQITQKFKAKTQTKKHNTKKSKTQIKKKNGSDLAFRQKLYLCHWTSPFSIMLAIF